MTLLDRQKEFTRALVAGAPVLGLAGLPLKSACAVTGNATQENLVKPVTEGPKDHGSDGTLQWRLDRLDGPHGLKGWSEAQGLDWEDAQRSGGVLPVGTPIATIRRSNAIFARPKSPSTR